MRRHLNNYVRNDLYKGRSPPPSYRRRFYPRRKDIDYHMAKAKLANRLAAIDQDNVEALIDKWKESSPEDMFFFRKREAVDIQETEVASSDDECLLNDEDSREEEDGEPEPSPREGERPLLFCYQTEQQRRLLQKYGEICLMDATYKTTRYALPLFFLCVRTNVSYQVVGTFVVQYSTTEAISEALQIFKTWNPTWQPRYFMTDFAEEEIHALEDVFEGSEVVLCDFHREKAWWEWTSKTTNGVLDKRDDVMSHMRRIAKAPTVEEMEEAISDFKESTVWKENVKLQKWFGTTWLPAKKRWCQAFRGVDFIVAVHTNNGIERQNETLKYQYLDGLKNCSLGELLTVLVEQFFPDSFRKYVDQNVRCLGEFSQYSAEIPAFLRNRPRGVVNHIMAHLRQPDERSAKRVKQQSEGDFMVDGKVRVQFGSDSEYPHCSCSEWRRHRLPCKHFCLIFSNIPGWGWEKLSLLYRKSPLLNLDHSTISGTANPDATDVCAEAPIAHLSEETAESSQDEMPQTLPLPPRQKSKCKVMQIHCRTILKEIISATYLIKDENGLIKLAEDIDGLYAKAKEMMPKEDGVPMGEEPNGNAAERKQGVQESSQKPRKTVPMSPKTYGAKKHPANGRFGTKAEWQRRFLPARNNSAANKHFKTKRQGKRKQLQGNEPSKKKAKIQSGDLPSKAVPNSSHDSTENMHEPAAANNKQDVQQCTHKEQDVDQWKAVLEVKGRLHQGVERFPEATRGTQCTTNSLVFLLQSTISKITKTSEMDELLQNGDQLHSLFNTSLGRAKSDKIGFDEIEEVVKHILGEDDDQCLFGPIDCGDVYADEAQPPFATLDQALQLSEEATGALLRVGDYTTAVQVNKDGSVRIYDPHARDESGFVSGSGTSVVIVFEDKSSFISYLRCFVSSKGTGQTKCQANQTPSVPYTWRSFELMPLFVKSKNCLPTLLKKIAIRASPDHPNSTSKTESSRVTPIIVDEDDEDGEKLKDDVFYKCSPTEKDFATLEPNTWLNDQFPNSIPKVHCFNSFFYKKLSSHGVRWLTKWTKRVNIFDFDLIVIPIHLPSHWALAVLNMSEKSTSYWDSISTTPPTGFYNNIRSFIKEEGMKRRTPFKEEEWKEQIPENVPKQQNNDDCGVFVCMFAECLTRGATPNFVQNDIPSLRLKIKSQLMQEYL